MMKVIKWLFPLWGAEKKRRRAYISAVCGFVLTLFLLSPLDLYLNNFTDFNIPFSTFVPSLIVMNLILFAAFLLIIPRLFPGKIRGCVLEIIAVLLCGIMLTCYLQILFFNKGMVRLTGDEANYSEASRERTINVIVWFAIISVPFILRLIIRKFNKDWSLLALSLSVVVVGMHAIGTVPAIWHYDGESVSGKHFFSYTNAFRLSENKNICVFIVDRLDVKYMDAALVQEPELHQMLDGFTYYRNNVSTHTNTFPALTYMLTGEPYLHGESWPVYWRRAWASDKHNLIDELRANGFGSTFLLDKPTTYGNVSQIADRADNIVDLYGQRSEIKHVTIARTTLDIAMSKVVPYYFKEFFVSKYGSGFSNSFYEIRGHIANNLAYPAVTNETDMIFRLRLDRIGVSAVHEHNMFTFIHLNGAHSREEERINNAVRSFYGINTYIEHMKELGIYDNSTIIIVADHGRPPGEVESGAAELHSEITSALLIKPADSRGDLEIDSVSELYHRNFAPAVLQAAGLPHEEYGLSYFDVIEGGISQTRTLYLNRWRSLGEILEAGKYEITGDANNFDNWTFIPP
jgi:hypothetical protein